MPEINIVYDLTTSAKMTLFDYDTLMEDVNRKVKQQAWFFNAGKLTVILLKCIKQTSMPEDGKIVLPVIVDDELMVSWMHLEGWKDA